MCSNCPTIHIENYALTLGAVIQPSKFTIVVKSGGVFVKEYTERDPYPIDLSELGDGDFTVCLKDWELITKQCASNCKCSGCCGYDFSVDSTSPPPPPQQHCCDIRIDWQFGRYANNKLWVGTGAPIGATQPYTVIAQLLHNGIVVSEIENPTANSTFTLDNGIYQIRVIVKDANGCETYIYNDSLVASSCNIADAVFSTPSPTGMFPYYTDWATPTVTTASAISSQLIELQKYIGGTWQTVYTTSTAGVLSFGVHIGAGLHRFRMTIINEDGCSAITTSIPYLFESPPYTPPVDPCAPIDPPPVSSPCECDLHIVPTSPYTATAEYLIAPALEITGGTAPYNVSHSLIELSNAATIATVINNPAQFNTPSALGVYQIYTIVSDARGCVATLSSPTYTIAPSEECDTYQWLMPTPSYGVWQVGELSPYSPVPSFVVAELQQLTPDGWQTLQTIANPSATSSFTLLNAATYRILVTMLGGNCKDRSVSPSYYNAQTPILPPIDLCNPPPTPPVDPCGDCIACNDFELIWNFGGVNPSTSEINTGSGYAINATGNTQFYIQVVDYNGNSVVYDNLLQLQNTPPLPQNGLYQVIVTAIDERGCTKVATSPLFPTTSICEPQDFWQFATPDGGQWAIGQPITPISGTPFVVAVYKFSASGWQSVYSANSPAPNSLIPFEYLAGEGYYKMVVYYLGQGCTTIQESGIVHMSDPSPHECLCIECSDFSVDWRFGEFSDTSWNVGNPAAPGSGIAYVAVLQQLIGGNWVSVEQVDIPYSIESTLSLDMTEHPAGLYRMLIIASSEKGCTTTIQSSAYIHLDTNTNPIDDSDTEDEQGCCLALKWKFVEPNVELQGCAKSAQWSVGSGKAINTVGSVTYIANLLYFQLGQWATLQTAQFSELLPSFDLSNLPEGLYAIQVIAQDASGCFDILQTVYEWDPSVPCTISLDWDFPAPVGEAPYSSPLSLGYPYNISGNNGEISFTVFIERQKSNGTWELVQTITNYNPEVYIDYASDTITGEGGNFRIRAVASDLCCDEHFKSPIYTYEKTCCCIDLVADDPICDLVITHTDPICDLVLVAHTPICDLDMELPICPPVPYSHPNAPTG